MEKFIYNTTFQYNINLKSSCHFPFLCAFLLKGIHDNLDILDLPAHPSFFSLSSLSSLPLLSLFSPSSFPLLSLFFPSSLSLFLSVLTHYLIHLSASKSEHTAPTNQPTNQPSNQPVQFRSLIKSRVSMQSKETLLICVLFIYSTLINPVLFSSL